ncbi:MAG: phage BR0599 family protein [Gammaproteobacteria bacterium]
MGDAYSVYRGCNKTLGTCRDVFGNVVNFRGEPHLPGVDQIFKFGGQR